MKYLIIGMALLFSSLLSAQTGHTPFFPAKEGASWQYQHYNGNDDLESTTEHTIRSVRAVGDSLWVTRVGVVLRDIEGDSIVGYEYQLLSRNSILFTNLLAMLGPQLTGSLLHMELGVTGDPFVLPPELTAGRKLPNAKSLLEAGVRSAEKLIQLDFDIKNAGVEAQETMRLDDRTIPVSKIGFDLDVLAMVKKRYRIVQYWTTERKPGLVRAEIYDRRGKLEGYSVVTLE
jgi:hypothetical protein